MKRKKDKQRKIIKSNKNYRVILITILTALIFLMFNYFTPIRNRTIEKQISIINKTNITKQLEQEGQTYRLVTSADNVQVPVPKGYVASGITGENYVTPQYQHTTNTYKGTYTELTWSSPEEEQYPWTQDSNGIWISGNQGIPRSTSTLESEEFDYIKGTTLTINYTYSSASGDYFNIDLINLTNNITQRIIEKKTGNRSSSFDYTTSIITYTMDDWESGRYKIRAIYSKNGSGDEGQDSGYINTSTFFKEDENGETIEEIDQKTKIHDGGFVIYQLTDEEIETDPNGTSVVINDTNKDTAQSTRNQYVWVPVPYVEDIVNTKTANNGIMQFGQTYVFRDTSITKVISSKEPRLIEKYDITKYYLQQYSNIDKREDYLKKMQEGYDRMIKSINKYKGFYIGRYETGDDYTHNSSKNCFTKPRVVRYNSSINFVTWYDSYKDLERLARKTEEYVKTGMIYDSLYDYTLKWLNETETKSYKEINSDSATWGNYGYNKKTVTTGSTEPAKTGAIVTITYNGEIHGDFPTSSNNIFDISGNLAEMTMARDNDNNRRIRGGTYRSNSNSSSTACYANVTTPNYSYNDDGVRCMLLIR